MCCSFCCIWDIEGPPPSADPSLEAFPAIVPAVPPEIGSAAVKVGESDDEEESVASAVDIAGFVSFCEAGALESAAAEEGWS
jgi:hypothetical protein